MTEKQALDNVIMFYNQINQSLTGHQMKLLEMSLKLLAERISPPEEQKEEPKKDG